LGPNYFKKGQKMTEQSEIWQVNGGANTRKCLKYGLVVNGCTLFDDCKDCIKTKMEVKDVQKDTKKPIKKPSTPNLDDFIIVKKRGKQGRNGGISRKNSNGKPVKVPKTRVKRKVRGRSRSPSKKS
jgi:hypothetical protein